MSAGPKPQVRILIVEDSEDDVLLLVREITRAGYACQWERVETASEMSDALARESWDAIVADYTMPRFSAPAALALLHQSGQDLPFVIVTGTIGEDIAIAAMKAGAHDYLMKANLTRLVPTIEREIREAEGRRQRKRAEERLKYLAFHDPLTGLPNRTMLGDIMQAEIVASPTEPRSFAVLLVDLDRFKEINYALGHRTADLLLQQVGARIRSLLGEHDTFARVGGDAFAVLMPGPSPGERALELAQKIVTSLELPFRAQGITLEVGATVGISTHPDHGEDSETLLRCADVAMHGARRRGASAAIYAPDKDAYDPRRLTLMAELRDAIRNDQLALIFQPQVSLRTGRFSGTEALLHWVHPELGLLSPDRFVPLAEHTGLIKPLFVWTLYAALRELVRWEQAGLRTHMSVNVSARNLHDASLPEQVARCLDTWKLTPDRLELEITESHIMNDPPRAREVLVRLSAMGVRLSIDDFGTGYSSLAYLKQLPVSAIKIDKSFVMGTKEDPSDWAIVRATTDLGHDLGLQVLAEGIETREALERLTLLGCDGAQGYFISPGLRADALLPWLDASPWCPEDRTASTRDGEPAPMEKPTVAC